MMQRIPVRYALWIGVAVAFLVVAGVVAARLIDNQGLTPGWHILAPVKSN